MRFMPHLLIGLIILTGAENWAWADQAALKTGRHALLVGCTHYPALDERFQLDGPGNDVVLMRRLLTTRFHFPQQNIVILSEQAGKERGPKYLPTRANIQREFRSLAKKAGAGDRVVILLAGHGSQQPDSNPDDPDRFEPDGLDEIFLPRDVGSWSDRQGGVKNAIIDDEIRLWLGKIRKKGASLWVIVDACHSASMIRGTEEEKAREVPTAKLKIPTRVLLKAEERARKMRQEKGRGEMVKPSPFKLPPAEPDLVAIYASQSTEQTVERLMPMEGANRKPYGLLTYTICQVLTQAKTPLTYTELVQRIHTQYLTWGRTSPTPLVEGKDRDREVLGDKEHRGRSRITLDRDEDGDWKVNAGALHGLTPGTVLAVYPRAGAADADKVRGHLEVTEEGLQTFAAKVKPCAHDGYKAPNVKALPVGGRCEIVFVNYGDQRVKVAVDGRTDRGEVVPEAFRRRLVKALQKLDGKNGSVLKFVASPRDDPRWLLRLDSLQSGKVYLVPASGWSRPGPRARGAGGVDELPPLFGPVLSGDELAGWLEERLGRIARVQNLMALAGNPEDEAARSDTAVKVKVEMVRLRNELDPTGTPVRWEKGGITLHKGDIIAFRVYNLGREPVDINLLLIDSNYGITAVFPKTVSVDNRWPPGDEPFRLKTRITTRTLGLEHLLVIAVKAQDVAQYANFSFLAQPSIERARSVIGGNTRGTNALNSPLGRLLQHALWRRGKSRGMDTLALDNHAFRLLSWQVSPKARKKK